MSSILTDAPKRSKSSEQIALSPRQKLTLKFLSALSWPLAWLPSSVGLALGAALGRLFFYLSARRRRIAVDNLKMIIANGYLPAQLDARRTARDCFANLGRSGWEAMVLFHRGLEPLMSRCQVESGSEHLSQALAECRASGRGLVILTGHMGNWELLCHYVAKTFGFKLHIIGRDSGQPVVDAIMHRLRTSAGDAYIPKNGGARQMLSTLKAGGVLGTLIDQAIGGPGAITLPFLGQPASTSTAPARLAHQTGSPMILALFRRQGAKNLVKIYPILCGQPDMDRPAALAYELKQLNRWLEEHIQKYPEQWMWGHRRWKTY